MDFPIVSISSIVVVIIIVVAVIITGITVLDML